MGLNKYAYMIGWIAYAYIKALIVNKFFNNKYSFDINYAF